MIEPFWLPTTCEALQPLDPALVAEIDDATLIEAVSGAGLAARIVLVTELLQRGRTI